MISIAQTMFSALFFAWISFHARGSFGSTKKFSGGGWAALAWRARPAAIASAKSRSRNDIPAIISGFNCLSRECCNRIHMCVRSLTSHNLHSQILPQQVCVEPEIQWSRSQALHRLCCRPIACALSQAAPIVATWLSTPVPARV